MKKLLSLLLILTLASGCNPDDTTSSDGNTGGSTTIPVETDPVTDPVGGTTGGATGNETKNISSKFIKIGVNDFITKPFTKEEFAAQKKKLLTQN